MHEEVVVRMVHTLGQAALADVLSHYNTNVDVIGVGEQTYRLQI